MSNLINSDDGSRFFKLWLALVLLVSATHAWALVICGLAPRMEIAFLAAPGSIMPMAVLSGFFVNQQDMTWVFRWFSYIDFLSYSWQALANAGFDGMTFSGGMYRTGEQILTERLHLPASGLRAYWINIGVLCGFVIFLRLLGIFLVARKLNR